MSSVARAVPRIDVVPLGRSGLQVSRIGVGLAGLGRPAYMAPGRDIDLGADRSIEAMRGRCLALLDAAYAAGLRYVDVARSYGLAEGFLNTWCNVRRLAAGAVTIGSKWGYVYTGAWRVNAPTHELKRLTIDMLRHQVVESRRILGTRLSLYQIHSATLDSGVLDDAAVVTELARLRECGIRIGLTVTGPSQEATIRRALDVRVDGVPLFASVQATWNLLEPSAAGALADAAADGRGVIVKEVLANGRLTDRHGGPELASLRAHAAAEGTTVEALAIAAALAQPWAHVVLSGAVTPAQLELPLATLDRARDAAERLTPMAQPAEEYWTRRATMPWC